MSAGWVGPLKCPTTIPDGFDPVAVRAAPTGSRLPPGPGSNSATWVAEATAIPSAPGPAKFGTVATRTGGLPFATAAVW